MCEIENQYTLGCSNADLIEPYLIMDKDVVVEKLVNSERVYFYDVCSIVGHGKSNNKEIILEYFKAKADVVVITEMVYLELCKGGSINENELNMLLYLLENGIAIYKMKEEWTYDLLVELSANYDLSKINNYLVKAASAVNNSGGTISRLLHNDRESEEEEKELCKIIRLAYLAKQKNLTNSNMTSAIELRQSISFYTHFFEFFRTRKVSEDGMGEELIMVISHLFTHAEYGQRFIATEDRSMAGKVSIVNESIEKVTVAEFRPLKICTTPTIIYWAIRSGYDNDRNKLKEVLESSKANPEDGFKVAFSHADTMRLMRGKFNSDELIDKIIDDPDFMINY